MHTFPRKLGAFAAIVLVLSSQSFGKQPIVKLDSSEASCDARLKQKNIDLPHFGYPDGDNRPSHRETESRLERGGTERAIPVITPANGFWRSTVETETVASTELPRGRPTWFNERYVLQCSEKSPSTSALEVLDRTTGTSNSFELPGEVLAGKIESGADHAYVVIRKEDGSQLLVRPKLSDGAVQVGHTPHSWPYLKYQLDRFMDPVNPAAPLRFGSNRPVAGEITQVEVVGDYAYFVSRVPKPVLPPGKRPPEKPENWYEVWVANIADQGHLGASQLLFTERDVGGIHALPDGTLYVSFHYNASYDNWTVAALNVAAAAGSQREGRPIDTRTMMYRLPDLDTWFGGNQYIETSSNLLVLAQSASTTVQIVNQGIHYDYQFNLDPGRRTHRIAGMRVRPDGQLDVLLEPTSQEPTGPAKLVQLRIWPAKH